MNPTFWPCFKRERWTWSLTFQTPWHLCSRLMTGRDCYWVHHDTTPLKCSCWMYFGVLIHMNTYEIHHIINKKPSILLHVSHGIGYDRMISLLPSTWISAPWIHWGLRCLDGWFQDASRCHWGWSLPHHWYQDGALAAEAADFLGPCRQGSWVVI